MALGDAASVGGAVAKAFTGVRAPSTLGTFLRAFSWGHVRQLESTARAFICNLTVHCNLLPGGDQVVRLDIDSKVKQVYGGAKQGAEHGYTKVKGLHFQIVTASTPLAAPVIVATRLRRGAAGSAKGAASLIAEAIKTVRAMGATGVITVRADSAFFSHKVVATCRRAKVRFVAGMLSGADSIDDLDVLRHVNRDNDPQPPFTALQRNLSPPPRPSRSPRPLTTRRLNRKDTPIRPR
ncbi:transposase [Kitasatospora sp. GP82]|uniref:transposase n=1 Tax=Kitasatospora sp. GP82 TaxID=3035089 RepID=UPI002476C2FD|nr:transposase [Kitasatospora sp. GP82]MDH6129856.1 hypothetical protein [Kitasatospora sp. GP82]